ncbi:MAG: hypothetical protein M1829_003884 [Trizodia sp. TS-e1964]|nr:MAG: hypothetical protein M1829_003884 [Trizodia sp. TS-e1964]
MWTFRSLCVGILTASTLIYAAPSGPQKRSLGDIPEFVIKHAPLVWLHSQESHFPSDLAAQLQHVEPRVDFNPVSGAPSPLSLDNLDQLNKLGGSAVFLTSLDDVTTNPGWLGGVQPNGNGKTEGIKSSVIIVNDRGNGRLDAFYFYFYAYNQGTKVFSLEFGDHVGDWEHNMIRFENGLPQAVWYSQHASGEAFTWDAVQKIGDRAVTFSAIGTHANYAIAGTHDHTIPGLNLFFGPVEDKCDQGRLWDPTLSSFFYEWTGSTKTFTPGNMGDRNPTAYLYFLGAWGDKQYPDSDSRQYNFWGETRFGDGPTGPMDKQLDRTNVCPDGGPPCYLRPFLTPR